jgi:hypothetical protein
VRPGLTSAKKPFHEQPNHCLPSLEDENSAGLTADEHKLVQADQFKVHYSRVQAHQRKVKLGAEKSVWHERARNAIIGPPVMEALDFTFRMKLRSTFSCRVKDLRERSNPLIPQESKL